MSAELKPCPFCGGEPHETDVFAYSSVKCRSCDFSITRKAGGDECAQDAWNRRAQPAEPQLDPITLRKMSLMIADGYAQVGVIMDKEGERAYVDMGKVTWGDKQ